MINKEENFIENFLKELSVNILPVSCSYQIENNEYKEIYRNDHWVVDEDGNSSNVEFAGDYIIKFSFKSLNNELKNCEIKFELTNYNINDEKTYTETAQYKSESKLFEYRIRALFDLLYDKWRTIKLNDRFIDEAYKKFVSNQIEEVLGKNRLDALKNEIDKVDQIFSEIVNYEPSRNKTNEIIPKNYFKVEDHSFTICVDGMEVAIKNFKGVKTLIGVLKKKCFISNNFVKRDNKLNKEVQEQTTVYYRQINSLPLNQIHRIFKLYESIFLALKKLAFKNPFRENLYSGYKASLHRNYNNLLDLIDSTEEDLNLVDLHNDFNSYEKLEEKFQELLNVAKSNDSKLLVENNQGSKQDVTKQNFKTVVDKIQEAFNKKQSGCKQSMFFNRRSDSFLFDTKPSRKITYNGDFEFKEL